MLLQEAQRAAMFELGLGAVAGERGEARPGGRGEEVAAAGPAGLGRGDVGQGFGLQPIDPQLAPDRHGDGIDIEQLDRVGRRVDPAQLGHELAERQGVLVRQEREAGGAQPVAQGVAGRAGLTLGGARAAAGRGRGGGGGDDRHGPAPVGGAVQTDIRY